MCLSSVTHILWIIGTAAIWEIAFFPRPKVGRWPSDIDGTVGHPIASCLNLYHKEIYYYLKFSAADEISHASNDPNCSLVRF